MAHISSFLISLTALAVFHTAGAYEIILPEKPYPWDKTAAAELESYLKKTVSAFTIGGKEAVFYIGDTAFARKFGLWSALMVE